MASGHVAFARLPTGDWENGQVCAVQIDMASGIIHGATSPRGMTAYAIGR